MNKPQRWTEARTDQVLKLWNDGVPAAEIARQMGFSRDAVKSKLRKIGAPQRDLETRRDEILKLHSDGVSIKEISARVGMTYHGTWNFLTRSGIHQTRPHGMATRQREVNPTTVQADTIRQMRGAGISFRRIGEHLGMSAEAVTDRAVAMGIHTRESSPETRVPEVCPEPKSDAAYVAACLAQGGFVYREIRGGRVVEVRP